MGVVEAILYATSVITGVATYYNPGVMDAVVQNRLAWGQLDLSRYHIGYVALESCDLIDEMVYIRWPDEVVEGPFLVADCARRRDIPYLHRIHFAVDVDWDTAHRHDMIGPMPVEVYVVMRHRAGWRPYGMR